MSAAALRHAGAPSVCEIGFSPTALRAMSAAALRHAGAPSVRAIRA
jgi:hypothetical protein